MARLDAKRTRAHAGILTRPSTRNDIEILSTIGSSEPFLPLRPREDPIWHQPISDRDQALVSSA